MIKYLLPLLLLCTSVLAQEKIDKIGEDVDPPKPPERIVITVPKGVLGDGKRLSPYEFDSTTKCFLMLNVTEPVSLKSLTWYTEDGPPDIEPINASEENPGTILSFSSGNVNGLFLVEADWDKGFSKVWLRIKGSGPQPPPIVDPVIPPGPGPIDPNVQPGFRVLTVYESTERLTKDQSNIMTSVRIRKYLDKVCSKGTEGQYAGFPEYRWWDKDGKDVAKDTPSIKRMWSDLAKVDPVTNKSSLTSVPMPFMAIEANGKKVVIPLRDVATADAPQATVETVMTALIKLGGPE